MDVYILRHGKAEDMSFSVKSDSMRRLTEAGKKELRFISRSIRNMDIELDYIVSSPLLRARQTAEIIVADIKCKKQSITFWDELKPESDVRLISKRLSTLKPGSSILLVGHEPLLSNLIGSIISADTVSIAMKKGSLAHVRCFATNSTVAGTLRSLVTPRQLKKLYG